MNTFAARLKTAIEKRGLSQAEAARKCGIAQQSLNYIINNNLSSSKLAPQIASALGINPEWLIFGHGRFEESKIYELPILHSFYMLKKYLVHELNLNTLEFTIIDASLGDFAFAYLVEPNKMAICSMNGIGVNKNEYLVVADAVVTVAKEKKELSFPIYEWRIRNVDF